MLIRKGDIPQIPDEEEDSSFGPAVKVTGGNTLSLYRKNEQLSKELGILQHDHSYHTVTRGTWSTPHLIAYIIDQIGPAECWLTSWSVKEQAIRILIELLDQKHLLSLNCLFDERIKVQCPQAHQLASNNVTRIFLTKIHAKVVVLKNEHWSVSIITSANLTRNPRIERFVVSTHRAVADFDLEWIEREISKASLFD